MVRDERPRIALGLGLFKNNGKALKKSFPIFVVLEDLSSFNPPGHHMLQEAGSVKSGLTGHDKSSKM